VKLLSPVALFCYNRPSHLRAVVDSLLRNEEAPQTVLYIFSDGPRSERDDRVTEVRKFLPTIVGFASVEIVCREVNYGLAKSIVAGVSEVLDRHETVIVLEDDIIVENCFLRFMNTALQRYENSAQVCCISGFVPKTEEVLPRSFFLRGSDCWGWATWKRAWTVYSNDAAGMLHELKSRRLTRDFDFAGSYPFAEMLRRRALGQNSSWAICWYASAYLNEMLCLYIDRSLVQNIGFDGTGTHCGLVNYLTVEMHKGDVNLEDIPVVESKAARDIISRNYRKRYNMRGRIKLLLERMWINLKQR
jgi:glycosyltransferase involved in cell wall biosynthesis